MKVPVARVKFDRLLLIGRSSVPLHIDALKAAITEAKKGQDTGRYRRAWDCLCLAAPDDAEAQFDRKWYDEVEAANKAARARLESELRGYKNNLVKESIRVGHASALPKW
jgi:COP9 signalosome complex subunit 1